MPVPVPEVEKSEDTALHSPANTANTTNTTAKPIRNSIKVIFHPPPLSIDLLRELNAESGVVAIRIA